MLPENMGRRGGVPFFIPTPPKDGRNPFSQFFVGTFEKMFEGFKFCLFL